MPKKTKEPWRKVLYGNRDYDDNYTDPSFLKDMKKNYNVIEYSFAECFCGVTQVSQELSCVTLFLVIFHHLYKDETMHTERLLLNSSLLTGVGYLIYIACGDFARFKLSDIREDFKTVAVVLLFGYMFSPLLQSLTNSISTDTIFSNTFIILFFHLLLHDYGIDGFLVSRTKSLNCGIFASICLASRLSTAHRSFVLLVIAAEVFVLKPLLFERIWRPWMLLPTVAITLHYLVYVSQMWSIVYLLTLTFINGFCPFIFQRLNQRKCTISGPWDEAVIEKLMLDGELDGKEKKRK